MPVRCERLVRASAFRPEEKVQRQVWLEPLAHQAVDWLNKIRPLLRHLEWRDQILENGVHALLRPVVRSRESDIFGVSARSASKSSARSAAMRPLGHHANSKATVDPVISAINDICNEDSNRSVEALKVVQNMISSQPEDFQDNIQTLVDALLDELDRAFTPLDNLHDPRFFRLVKHILQTLNAFSTDQELVRRLSYDDIYSILSSLSLRMVQADPMGGHFQELTRFHEYAPYTIARGARTEIRVQSDVHPSPRPLPRLHNPPHATRCRSCGACGLGDQMSMEEVQDLG